MRVSDDDMVAWVGESYDPPFIMEDLVQDLLDARRELAEADQAFSDLTNSTDILLANAREEIERLKRIRVEQRETMDGKDKIISEWASGDYQRSIQSRKDAKEIERLRGQRDLAMDAMKSLYVQLVESGNAGARDFGWPEAEKKYRAALASLEEK